MARTIGVIGDRWTLLILRELANGDQRFTQLRQHLPGIAPTLLTQRLKTLVAQGLTNGQIAEKLNLSPTALYTARSVLGIVSPAKREAFGVKPWWLPAMAAGATVDTICKAA